MRRNLARNAIGGEPGNSVDIWNEIRYLDPDLQCSEKDDKNSDRAAIIIIALLFGLVLISGLSLYVRTVNLL